MRTASAVLWFWILLGMAVVPSYAGGLLDFIRGLEETGGAASAERLAVMHQLRNAEAMWELVMALPETRRPSRVLYLASGAHLAPLVVCEALPEPAPCLLRFTEIDPTVQEGLHGGLMMLGAENVLRDLSSDEPIPATGGTRTWSFSLGEHPVRLTLRVDRPAGGRPRLVRASDLASADLVISHDWSGDPFGNLGVILQYLMAVRSGRGAPSPLMIEDLEQHPYPVDLSLFGPVARTARAYGHRTSDAGLGRHGSVELGPPLFGGGVILGFGADWLRRLDLASVEGVFDLLLLNQFDVHRQNVLEGGDEPLVAPALLDWWSGYGIRTISGSNVVEDPDVRQRMVRAAARLSPLLGDRQRGRLACRLQLYRSLLHMIAAGTDLKPFLPPAGMRRTLEPGQLPSPDMERLYREARANLAVYRATQRRWQAQAAEVLALLESPTLARAIAPCDLPEPVAEEPSAQYWSRAYREILGALE